MGGKDVQHAPADCENCGTPLRGHYCYECGQSVHSPTRHFGHALEEVFESFWHLDGRVFRTLRDLLVPGRIARNYLAGQRVRYIAPLRLFVILSLVTFFVGRLVVHVDQAPIQFGGEGGAAIDRAKTVAEVRQVESRLLAKLAVDEKKAARTPGVNPALVATRVAIQGAAADRIAELEEIARDRAEAKPSAATPDATKADAPTRKDDRVANAPAAAPARAKEDEEDHWRFNDRDWDEKTNPVDIAFLPGFADRWLNHKIGRAKTNLAHMQGNPDQFVQAFLGAVPTALFLLMPVFALLLKVFYLGSGRRYLEHIVVALYSHAWLLLVLLAMFVLNAIKDASGAGWVAIVTALLTSLLWIWAPIYLFVMQHRVYGDRWLITTLRYVMIGSIYLILVFFVVMFAVLAGIAS